MNAEYFNENFGETYADEIPSYSVKLQALRFDDFVKSKAGKKFLQALLHTENLDLYNIETIHMLIEFLFQKFKRIVIQILFPIYLL